MPYLSRSSYSSRSRSPYYSRSVSRSRSRSRSLSPDAENPGNNLYVTGLSSRATKRDVEKHFSREGKVVNVHLVVDPWTKESRGFGFVTMASVEDANRCLKYLDRSVLEGRVITVEKMCVAALHRISKLYHNHNNHIKHLQANTKGQEGKGQNSYSREVPWAEKCLCAPSSKQNAIDHEVTLLIVVVVMILLVTPQTWIVRADHILGVVPLMIRVTNLLMLGVGRGLILLQIQGLGPPVVVLCLHIIEDVAVHAVHLLKGTHDVATHAASHLCVEEGQGAATRAVYLCSGAGATPAAFHPYVRGGRGEVTLVAILQFLGVGREVDRLSVAGDTRERVILTVAVEA